MKILHITFSLLNAGKENMLVDIANEQFKSGNELGILVINNNVEQSIRGRIDNNVTLYELKRTRASKSIIPIVKLIIILRLKFKADIIHVHDPVIGRLVRLFCKTKIVLTIHNTNMEIRPMYGFSRIFAISKAVKQDIESRSNLKCTVIYNGIKTQDIRVKESINTPNNYQIIHVKRLDYKAKGQDLLVRAFDILVNKHGRKNLKLHFVGEGSSKEYIQQMIIEFKLNDQIVLLGNKSREWVYENLRNYDLFVHPSRIEGFGLTVTEAMVAKVPVISSNVEGPAEILEYGKYGLMFENNSYEDLAFQIEHSIKMYEKGEMAALTELAYSHCLANFNIVRTAKDYCVSYFED